MTMATATTIQGPHTGTSKLVTCPECGKELRKRGLWAHIHFKHPNSPLRLEQAPAVAEDRATPVQVVDSATRAQLTGRHTAEKPTPVNNPERRQELAEKRQGGSGWLLAGLLVAILWVSRRSPSEAIVALESREKKPIMGERH